MKSNRALRLPAAAGGWCEAGLGLCLLLLPPLLALVPRGAAPLEGVAGLLAAGLMAARRLAARPGAAGAEAPLGALRLPAALLGGLVLWGALSALWSIDPGRSLLIAARLLGLFTAGLALAAAAPHLASPRRLLGLVVAGSLIGIAVAVIDLATAGGLSRYVTVRPFAGPRLNQISVWLALAAWPVAAALRRGGRRLAAGLVAGAMVVMVYRLDDTTAKLALTASVPAALLCYWWRGAAARAAAVLAVLAIVLAPAVLPQLARLPGVFAATDAFKESAGHRLLIWSFVGDRIAERPFAGWGLDSARAIPGGKDEIRPGENWLPLHPHDSALQVWLELGVPGAVLFALFVGLLCQRLAASPWPPPDAAAAGGSLAVALVVAVTAWGLWEEWWVGTLALALFAVLALARVTTPATSPRPQ